MIKNVCFFAVFLFLSCQNKPADVLHKSFELPNKLKEVSGFTSIENKLWCIEDSGNENELYQVDSLGNITKTIVIEKTPNIDWEDITEDSQGNLYIGDFGNNDNDRQNLCIYKFDKNNLQQKSALPSYKISFAYPEQTEFPPKKKNLLFDVEGFFELNNYFYLITKNRSKNFDGRALVYKIPNQAGQQTAILIGEIKTGTDFENGAITSAAISDDHKKVVLLTHSKIIVFENFGEKPFFEGYKSEISLNHLSQKESICFKNNTTLFIADEKDKGNGGIVYEMTIN